MHPWIYSVVVFFPTEAWPLRYTTQRNHGGLQASCPFNRAVKATEAHRHDSHGATACSFCKTNHIPDLILCSVRHPAVN